MMGQDKYEKLLRKALVLDTQERSAFLEEINDSKVKNNLEKLFNDDSLLTEFVVKTALNIKPLLHNKINDFVAGDRIKQFLIKRLIAKGGMGSVFLAYDEKLKRNVAIKSIRAEFLHHKLSQQRFEKEAQILSQINHPAICQIYDFIDYEDGDLLVLELVNGQTLGEFELSDEQQLDVFIQLASALEAAHNKGVIHRDLKPDNIMLTDDGKIKILDFGIAKSQGGQNEVFTDDSVTRNESSELTQVGSMMGTLSYMSPEQAAAEEIGSASDIYSMAVIMVRMITGRIPYQYKDTENLRKQIINAQFHQFDLVPKKYQKLIKWMSQKDAQLRPSAAELKKELKTIQEQPKQQSIKRKRYLIAAIVVLLMLSLGVVLYRSYIQEFKNSFILDTQEKIFQANQIIEKAYTLPKHDISAELKQANQLLDTLQIEQAAHLEVSEKAMLKGEAFYATKKYTKAIPLLEKAWHEGVKKPQLAAKIATALIMKYWQDHFTNNDSKGDSNSYRFQNMKNMDELLEKASGYFLLAHSDTNQKEMDIDLINAYRLYTDSKYHDALLQLDMKQAQRNGDYIKYNLLGNIHRKLYEKYFLEDDTKQADEHLKEAISAFENAIKFGRSFPDSYINLCDNKIEEFENVLYQHWADNPVLFQNTYNICQDAIEVMPTKSFSINKITELLIRYTDFLSQIGVDPKTHLLTALDWNRQALELDSSPYGFKMKAFVYDSLAVQKLKSGESPLVEIDQSIQAYHQAIELKPRHLAKHASNILIAIMNKVEYKMSRGMEFDVDIKQAEDMFNKAIESGLDTKGENMYLYVNLGLLQHYMAQYQFIHQGNVMNWLEKSSELYRQVLDVKADTAFVRSGLLENKVLQAKVMLNDDQPIDQLLIEIQGLIQELETELNNYYWFSYLLYEFEKVKLKSAIAHQQDHTKYLNQMENLINESIKLNPTEAESYLKLAEINLIRIMTESGMDNDQNYIQSGLKSIAKGQSINPNSAEVYWIKALLLEQAKTHKLETESVINEIDTLKARAIKINPDIVKYNVY